MKLTAELLEAFSGMYLSPRYDDPRPTPAFHLRGWALYCSDTPSAMIIAPRDHAKTTAFTVDYTLAEILFRCSDYVILIGSTEANSQETLSNISDELHENEDLRRDFGIESFEVDQKTEIIVKLDDGHRFRILAKASGQRIRGKMWNGKRPNLIVCDDMEDDEQVENRARRAKFRRWFFRAAKQALSRSGRIRVHGTVLHEDSLLARLRKNSAWKHQFYKAHAGFDDFSDILWPQRWSESDLRMRRQEFIDDRDAAGYSQEFLNDPFDNDEAYLRREDFLEMDEPDYDSEKIYAAAADFAISTADHANRTSITVGGKDLNNLVHIVDERVGRWQPDRIIDEIFSVQLAWNPDLFYVEDGHIWKSLAQMVYREMQLRNCWINIVPKVASRDKAARGRSLQRRHRAHGMRFDKTASWYEPYEAELLRFTGLGEAIADDQFDSTSLLSIAFDDMPDMTEEDLLTEEEWIMMRNDPRQASGRSKVTGY